MVTSLKKKKTSKKPKLYKEKKGTEHCFTVKNSHRKTYNLYFECEEVIEHELYTECVYEVRMLEDNYRGIFNTTYTLEHTLGPSQKDCAKVILQYFNDLAVEFTGGKKWR